MITIEGAYQDCLRVPRKRIDRPTVALTQAAAQHAARKEGDLGEAGATQTRNPRQGDKDWGGCAIHFSAKPSRKALLLQEEVQEAASHP